MISATAEMYFKKKNKKYKYRLSLPDSPTAHDISIAISNEISKDRGSKRINPRKLPGYELCMFLLSNHARIQLPHGNPDPRKDAYTLANERNQESKPVMIECEHCNGKGELENWELGIEISGEPNFNNVNECPACKGRGFKIWILENRVGRNPIKDKIPTRLLIDIDNHDLENLKEVKTFYEHNLKQKFTVAKTGGGFWLAGNKQYASLEDWEYDNCRLLNPVLQKSDFVEYKKKLIALDNSTKKMIIGSKNEFNKMIKNSGLYIGVGTFDLMFTLISIKTGRHTIRDSQKFKGDKIEILGDDLNA